MAQNPIQGVDQLIKFSEDGGTTKLTAVCVTSTKYDGNIKTSEKDTQCGPIVGMSKPSHKFMVDLVMNTTPASGEASYKKLLSWFNSRTKLYVERSYGSGGTDLFMASDNCTITKLGDDAPVGDVMSVSVEVTVVGDLDITP